MELSDKVRLIIGAVVLLIIVGAGVAFFARTTKKPTQTKVEATQTQEMTTTPNETPTPTTTPEGTTQGQSQIAPASGSTTIQNQQGATSQGQETSGASGTTKGGLPVSQTQSSPQGNTTSSTSNMNTATTYYWTSWPSASQQQQQQQHICVSIGGSDCSSSDGLNQSQSLENSTQSQSM